MERTIDGFVFIDVNPFIEAGSGEGYYFKHDGQTFVIESWATRNASGEDVYTLEGHSLSLEDVFDGDEATVERFEAALEVFKERWREAWDKLVEPAIHQAKQRALMMP